MRSGEVASKRRRGVVLTSEGQQRLQAAIAQIQDDEYDGQKLTIEELSGRTRLDPGTVSKVLDAEQGVDRRTLKSFFQTLNLELVENDYCKAESSLGNGLSESRLAVVPAMPESAVDLQIDWGEAPDVSIFYGRTDELDQLEQWIVGDRCRLITVLGMGGIGKTSLTARLIERLVGGRNQGFRTASVNALPERRSISEFEYVVWYSLRNAPTIEEAISYLVRFLNGQSGTVLPKSLDSLISLLLQRLEQSRCLVVLDNTESILRGGDRSGAYRDGFVGYGELIRRVGEALHQSCLVLTSREKPREVGLLEGQTRPVRSLQLSGLQPSDGIRILEIEGMSEAIEAQRQLIDRCAGNPLALKLVATTIQELFAGDIARFLDQGAVVVEDIREVLDAQFERLTPLEQEVMYWLAINREPSLLELLQDEIVSPILSQRLLDALGSLRRRSLIDSSRLGFTLQNVVMEYIIDQFIEQISNELSNEKFEFFHSHALIQATAKDYIRETQIQLILKPIFDQSIITPEQVAVWLQAWRSDSKLSSGYAAGNLLNLLCYQNQELSNYDFSCLTIRQAYLKSVKLYDVNFSKAQFIKPSFTQPLADILSVAFSPDGTLLATGDSNSEIRLWHVAEHQQVAMFQGHDSWVRSIAFSSDGSMIVSGSIDYTVRLWHVKTGQCLHVCKEHEDELWSVAFSPDGKTIASGSADHTIRLWQVETGQCLQVCKGHTDQVVSVAFSPDGKTIASGSADHTIRLWQVETGQCLQVCKGHTKWVFSVAFSPDGKMLASGSVDCTIRLWLVEMGQCLQVLQGHDDWLQTIAFSPDGSRIVSGGADHTVRLWQVETGQCLQVCEGHAHWVQAVAFSPDGKTIASGSADQTIRFWLVETGQCLQVWEGYTNRIFAAVFSPDGKTIASGSEDRSVRLWETETGRCLQVYEGHTHWTVAVDFSPDGKTIASGNGDRTIRLWHVGSGRCSQILAEHTNRVWSVAFSPDGKWLASGSEDRTIRLWHVETGQCLQIWQGHTNRVWSVAFSPDGKWLASGSEDRTIRLWHVETGQCLQIWQGHSDQVFPIAFSPDGRLLASGSADATVRLWQVETGQCLRVLEEHTHWVFSVEFSPDGKTLVSGGADGTIRTWAVEAGTCLAVLRTPRPYEGTNIADIRGLNEALRNSLRMLGAVERP